MKKLAALFLLTFISTLLAEPLVVHEWGTFTSLQDEKGDAIGGINTDDEPVPNAFVHRLSYHFLLNPSDAPPRFFQGVPSCHPDVTMRLETPVIYFYPPKGESLQPLDVHVSFRGGWLTEFYPGAEAKAPNFDSTAPHRIYPYSGPIDPNKGINVSSFGHLKGDAIGELAWNGLIIGGHNKLPETKEQVWLAPRAVQSAQISTAKGESEQFLFYRGVGNIDASLRVVRNENTNALTIYNNIKIMDFENAEEGLRVPAAWLVEVSPNGKCAFKALSKLEFHDSGKFCEIPGNFLPKDFSKKNQQVLREDIRKELIKAGLFKDEADALLNTWKISYFQSPGLRLFYICPRAVTDNLLPLSISAPCDLVRVMIGRIEIITPEQRALLKKLAIGPAPDLSGMRGATADSQSEFFKHPENTALWNDIMAGKKSIRLLGLTGAIKIPPLYIDYLNLGRFRNALILNEEKNHPTPALKKFISENGFEAYPVH